ncbi:taurine ABC transporter substrate-binding protein [Acinetobacter boissieri]|uniref:Taurine transport system substrate-binding protein n=1 Tax=Acinetobacter boissieri TaxID=1219383 RepID=A0A1G6GJY5_9GAMM|nr:taurine ABC transporter substrate-binding protein [Acinetobacter boissieri]SDB82055.1 taurine transport system substrate-binding protein [Acinetobacter boissieri]
MKKQYRKPLTITILIVVALVGFLIYQSSETTTKAITQNETPIVIAYQTGVDPSKVAQVEGLYEKNSQHAISWKKFDTGSDVVTALASGDVAIGNIGSSPFAAAASRGVPIEAFLITAKLGSSEALVVQQKSGIKQPSDLIGKTIAVPFVSTTHYSLLSALKHWNISEDQVKIINLRPPEIIAAWNRGDIDAAYVWEPALNKVKETGQVLVDSEQVGQWGAPTYDLWVVRKDFAEKNPEFLKSFVSTTLNQLDKYNQSPDQFTLDSKNITDISTLTGSKPEDIKLLLSGNRYLNRQQQIDALSNEFSKNVLDTAQFLKQQGKVDQVKPNYQDNVSTAFLK